MPPPLPPAARERRRAAVALLERALLVVLLWRLGGALADVLAPVSRACGPPVPLRVDLARDPAWRLEHLPGIGPARARALVRDRAEHGPPRRLEELLRVPGLTAARLEALRTVDDVEVVLDRTRVSLAPSPEAPR